MIGELFEHVRARFDLALLQLWRNFDPLRFLADAVFKRPLDRQIDEPTDLLSVPDRNLPCDQRGNAHWLQRGQEVAHAPVRLVYAVDEDEMWNAQFVERAQRRGCERCSSRVGIDD